MSKHLRTIGSPLRFDQLQSRKQSQPDMLSGRERTPGGDSRAKTLQSFRAKDPTVPSKRNITSSKSPQTQRQTTSPERSLSLASTALRLSTEKKNPNINVSPFFKKDFRPNSSRERASPPKPNSSRPLSETVKGRLNEINRAKQESKEIGREALVNAAHKKELALQVQALENRIRKLKQEEEQMIKKIQETTRKTEKVANIKKRRMEDLFDKARKKEKETYELIRRKRELAKERENQKYGLKKSVEGSFREKKEIASNVKQDNAYLKKEKERKLREQNERNKELINCVKSLEKSVVESKAEHERLLRSDSSKSFFDKIRNDKEEQEALGKKLKDLSAVEEQLVNRLNQTYSIHKMKFEELEKMFNLRVSAPNVFEEIDPKAIDPKKV